MTPVVPIADLEKAAIVDALETYGHDAKGKRAAAQALGIGLKTLYNKLHEYGLAGQYVDQTYNTKKQEDSSHE